jgi:hypothetical protein
MRMVFTGDLSASGVFERNIQAGTPILSDEIRAILRGADFVHVNLENPITNRPFRPGKEGAALRAPTELGRFLTRNHIGVCCLANNHIMDCGEEGLGDTTDLLQEEGALYYGIGSHPYLLLDHEGIRVGLMASAHKEGPMGDAHTPGPCSFSQRETIELVRHLKHDERVDYIAYNFHGGTEFNLVPEPSRRRFFHSLDQYGVDVVVGHHAHVPQGYELLDGGVIFYGLGNFVFDLPYHRSKPLTNTSFLLQIDLEPGEDIRFERYPYYIDFERGQVLPLDEGRAYLRGLVEEKTLVFESEEQYQRAWLDEAWRVYLNAPVPGEKSEDRGHSPKTRREKRRGLARWTSPIKRIFRDVQRPDKRPLLMGSVQRILKYGFPNKM